MPDQQVGMSEYEAERLLVARAELAEVKKANKTDWWHRLSAAASVAALIVSVVALLIVARQGQNALKEAAEANQKAAEANEQAATDALRSDRQTRYGSVTELSLDVDMAIAEHPDLISCFMKTVCDPGLTRRQKQQASALSFYILDFYQYLQTQMISMGAVPDLNRFMRRSHPNADAYEDWVTWSETMISGFQHSRLLCQSLGSITEAYSSNFVQAVHHEKICPGI